MHNTLMILRREYLERVTKKSFWIGTAVFPVLMVLLSVGPMALFKLQVGKQKHVGVVDETGRLGTILADVVKDEKLADGSPSWVLENVPVAGSLEATQKTLEPRVRDGSLYGILTIGKDIDAEDAFHFACKNPGDIQNTAPLEGLLKRAVVRDRFETRNLGIDKAEIAKIVAPIDMKVGEVTKEGGVVQKNFMVAYLGTLIFVMMLFFTLLVYGIAMMRGILEEKSSRVMEVLLGSVSPNELMTGKILGIGLVGLTQIGIYALTGGLLRLVILSRFASQTDLSAIAGVITISKLVFFLVYFLLGYFMYVAAFACVGAVCNSEQEAQNLQAPITWCLMLPMIATFFFVNQPDSTIALTLSLIPIFTPMVMFMRIIVQTPPMWQILLSIAITSAFTWVLFRAAAKVFRIGILMYGKRPTIPEIMRWARS